jgi:methylglutaconyl-CoA hydratase
MSALCQGRPMTTEPGIIVHEAAGTCTLTLARPSKRNALSRDLMARLTGVFAEIDRDPSVRVVVLAAEGPVFCAGGDIAEYTAAAGTGDDRANVTALSRLLEANAACPAPVIARVHGDVFGGGVGLLCAADIVVATRAVRFALSEARLGLIPAAIAPYVLRALGEHRAKALMLLAAPFDTAEAQACGLVHSCVADEDLDTTIAELCEQVMLGAPGALATIKQLPGLLDGLDLATSQDLMANLHAVRLASDEGLEGLAAFLAKRPPAWAPGDSGPD